MYIIDDNNNNQEDYFPKEKFKKKTNPYLKLFLEDLLYF